MTMHHLQALDRVPCCSGQQDRPKKTRFSTSGLGIFKGVGVNTENSRNTRGIRDPTRREMYMGMFGLLAIMLSVQDDILEMAIGLCFKCNFKY